MKLYLGGLIGICDGSPISKADDGVTRKPKPAMHRVEEAFKMQRHANSSYLNPQRNLKGFFNRSYFHIFPSVTKSLT